MVKQRRQRQKLHLPAKKESNNTEINQYDTKDTSQPILIQPTENLFAGIHINFDGLKQDLSEDTRSVKSFKSAKSEVGGDTILPKKDKIKLRREVLLKKIDAVNQMKMESKQRKRRKNVSIIGDTNPLHDALPSLQSLLESRSSTSNRMIESQAKPKGIQKATKRKKLLVQGVQTFKTLLSNKDFQKNPLQMVSEQIQAIVNYENIRKCVKIDHVINIICK